MLDDDKDIYVIDGHNDLAWQIRKTGDFDLEKYDLSKNQPEFHTDIPRLVKGGVGAQFWSAYVSPVTEKKGTAVRDTLEQIALIHTFVNKYPDTFAFARTVADIVEQRSRGKIASLIGVEGGYSIDNSIGVLRAFYHLGVRYLTLTHNFTTSWADSATDEPKHNGMTEFGHKVVCEMNRLGMMVDIAHVSWGTMRDVLATSQAPVLSTHSGACAITDQPRNIPDDLLKKIAKGGGMVMACFASSMVDPEAGPSSKQFYKIMTDAKNKYITGAEYDEKAYVEHVLQWLRDNPSAKATLANLADHIDHMVKVMGIDHVGLGSDFGGTTNLPEGLEDVSKYPNLTAELFKRGYSKDNIKKIYSENILRLMKQVEDVAARLTV